MWLELGLFLICVISLNRTRSSPENGPVYLTKNGYGNVVVLSIEDYANLTDDTEQKLLEADKEAITTAKRYTHDEIFNKAKEKD